MLRADLIESVRATMQGAGFVVSDRCDLRPVSFDLVARRRDELVMLKVLANVDALSEEIAHEIKILCKFLDARPILVGLRSGAGELEAGVVYARHDIPIVTPDTLEDFVRHGTAPMAFAAPGGFYVQIDAAALRRERELRHLSLGVVAQVAGVSRRAIQMYEEGMSASIDAAMRLEEFLQSELIRPLDPLRAFDPAAYAPPPQEAAADPMEQLVTRMLQGLGYSVRSTRRSPFNALSTEANAQEQAAAGRGAATGGKAGPANAKPSPPPGAPRHPAILTGMSAEDSPQLRRRARLVHSVSSVTGHPGFFVIERTTRTSIEGVPVVTRVELRKLTDPESIRDLILEREPEKRDE